MALKRQKYDVHIAGPADQVITHQLEITHGDRLRGEFEAKKHAIPPINEGFGMNHTTIWLWCAMVRLGLYTAAYQQFAQVDLLDFDAVEGEAGETDVDPTTPAPSGLPSPSPATTAADPTTGSTPTSTST